MFYVVDASAMEDAQEYGSVELYLDDPYHTQQGAEDAAADWVKKNPNVDPVAVIEIRPLSVWSAKVAKVKAVSKPWKD